MVACTVVVVERRDATKGRLTEMRNTHYLLHAGYQRELGISEGQSSARTVVMAAVSAGNDPSAKYRRA